MNSTLLTAFLASVPITMLLVGSAIYFLRSKGIFSLLQFLGAACLFVVVVVHVLEGLALFPVMGWGLEHSPGHYVDLGSAVLGVVLFPTGYLVHSIRG